MDTTDINIFNQDKYIAHYTNTKATKKILKDNKIRLGFKKDTNDPYEADKNWDFDEQHFTTDRKKISEIRDIRKKIRKAVNKHIQLFCAVKYKDKPIYNKPTHWAHYGDNYKGVCLIFNKNKLYNCFKKNNKILHYIAEEIKYIDYDIENQSYLSKPEDKIYLDNLLKDPILLLEEVNKINWIKNKYFKKDIDWCKEDEYRFLVFSKNTDNIYIDYDDSLEAIVLGSKVGDRLKNCFEYRNIKKYRIKYNEYNKYEYLQIV